MMSLLLYIFFFIAATMTQFFGAIIWAIELPGNFARHQSRLFRDFLTDIPQIFREKIKMWDSFGLRHNRHYLRRIALQEMIQWPVEKQAEFANHVTVVSVKNRTHVFDIMQIFGANDYDDPEDYDATAIGNLAFLVCTFSGSDDTVGSFVTKIVQKKLDEIRAYYTSASEN